MKVPIHESRQCRESGFLYVEAIVAVTLLAFILLSAVPMFVMASRQSAASGDMTVAANLAQDKAETLMAGEFATLASGTDTVRVELLSYRRTWTVQNNVPFAGLKTITVTVQPLRGRIFGPVREARVSFYRAL